MVFQDDIGAAVVGIKVMKLDHIMFAANDLDAGMAYVNAMTGSRVEPGGSHPGSGTRNGILPLGSNEYLEVIAPDPAQALTGTLGEVLAGVGQPGIRTWAASTNDFESLASVVEAFGYRHRVIPLQRTRPDGALLAWRLMFVSGHSFDRALPFFIDWQESPHPSADSSSDCELAAFEIRLPQAKSLEKFCHAIGLEVSITTGELAMKAKITCPSGEAILL